MKNERHLDKKAIIPDKSLTKARKPITLKTTWAALYSLSHMVDYTSQPETTQTYVIMEHDQKGFECTEDWMQN